MAIIETDITYATAGDLELRLDIFRPGKESKRCAILYFHGGGWRGGSKAAMHGYAKAMADHGFTGVAVQYRLLGQAPWPAQIHDVKNAIRWVRAHADELGVDDDKIIVWGASAGGHLALLAAGTGDLPLFEGDGPNRGVSSKANGVIALFPPTGFFHGEATATHTSSGAGLLGEGYSAEAAREASPITYAGPDYPPALFFHGTSDRVVHHSASIAMVTALREARAPADLHLFHGHTHEFLTIPSVRAIAIPEVAYFLERSVIDPAKFKAEAEEFNMFARPRPAPAA